MRWSSKLQKWGTWHHWYAWHPVLIGTQWVWLEWVVRKQTLLHDLLGEPYKRTAYRLPELKD